MKEIPLTQGKVALVDDADFEFLNQWKWYAMLNKRVWYAVRDVRTSDGSRRLEQMHQILIPSPQVDHRDHDGLNNQRANLRACSVRQNGANKRRWLSKTTSRFKGVFERKNRRTGEPNGQYRAQIRVDYKLHNLGTFGTEYEAAQVYDAAAKEHFGEFAHLNFPENSSCTLTG
jgi:hypothetical protein